MIEKTVEEQREDIITDINNCNNSLLIDHIWHIFDVNKHNGYDERFKEFENACKDKLGLTDVSNIEIIYNICEKAMVVKLVIDKLQKLDFADFTKYNETYCGNENAIEYIKNKIPEFKDVPDSFFTKIMELKLLNEGVAIGKGEIFLLMFFKNLRLTTKDEHGDLRFYHEKGLFTDSNNKKYFIIEVKAEKARLDVNNIGTFKDCVGYWKDHITDIKLEEDGNKTNKRPCFKHNNVTYFLTQQSGIMRYINCVIENNKIKEFLRGLFKQYRIKDEDIDTYINNFLKKYPNLNNPNNILDKANFKKIIVVLYEYLLFNSENNHFICHINTTNGNILYAIHDNNDILDAINNMVEKNVIELSGVPSYDSRSKAISIKFTKKPSKAPSKRSKKK